MGLREVRARNLARYRPESIEQANRALYERGALTVWGLLTIAFVAIARPSVPAHDWWSVSILGLMILVWFALMIRWAVRVARATGQLRRDRLATARARRPPPDRSGPG